MKEVQIVVKTNAHSSSVSSQPDGVLKVTTIAKPIEGEANKSVIKLLSKHFGVPKSRISIKSGQNSHYKTIIIK